MTRSRAAVGLALVACVLAAGGHAARGEASDDDGAKAAEQAKAAKTVKWNDAPTIVAQVFDEKKPAFCHDPQYPLTREELAWCALMPAKDDRCPELTKICALGARAKLITRERSQEIVLPEIALPGRVLLWALLGAGLLFVVLSLSRHALSQVDRKADPVRADPADEGPSPAEIKARIVETDVARLLALAAEAAGRADFGQALAHSYAALLRKLEGADIVRVEAHRTNGDHLRDVAARKPALRPPVAEVVGAVEAVEFGGEPPTAERWQEAHRRVLSVVGQHLGALLVAVGLLGVLGAAGCSSERSKWDESPSGRAYVLRVLEKYGFDVHERFASLSRLGAKDTDPIDQVIVTPGAAFGEESNKALEAWVRAGGTAVMAGVDKLPAWIGGKMTSAGKSSAPLGIVPGAAKKLGRLRVAVPGDHGLSGFDGSPLLARGAVLYAAEREIDDGRVIVLADDYLLTNAALLVADDVRVLTELLRPAGKRVDVANELTGLAAETPLESVKRGRMAPVLCQLAVLALLFFMFKGTHFGRPVDPAVAQRRAFAEHARAVGARYALARANRLSLELYAAYAFERLRDRLNLGANRTLSATAEAVATRTGRPLGDVMRVLVEARDSQGQGNADAGAAASDGDLQVLRQVAALVAETHPQRKQKETPR